MNKRFFYIINILLFLLLSDIRNAQAQCDPDLDPFGCGNIDDPAPLDEGVLILMTAAAVYGIKKIRDNKHSKSQQSLV